MKLPTDWVYLYKEQKAAEEAYKTFSEEALRANEALETVKKTIEENTNATRMLSDEEAEYLICKQEFGRALNEEQQKELNAWKLANEATEAELQRANEEQQAIMEGRLEIVRNAFGRMSQDTAISVEDMVENLRQNANATEQWTKDMETLAGSGLEEGFLAELQEKGPAAAAQVHEIVKFMEDERFDGFAELNAQWRRGGQATLESMNLGLKDGDPTEGVDYVLNENAMAAKLDRSVPGELVNLVAFSKGEMVKAVSRQGFESVGESIAMRVSNGIYDASQKYRISRHPAGLFLISLSQAFSQKRVHPHSCANPNSHHQHLYRKCQRQRIQRGFTDSRHVGYKGAVYNIIECLNHHG